MAISCCDITPMEEAAYDRALENEYNELLVEAGFGNSKWTILEMMQGWGMKITYEAYGFLRHVLASSATPPVTLKDRREGA